MQESKRCLPSHVGIIMDGNGRWATEQNKLRAFGHKAGTERVKSVISYCGNRGIKILTLYAFSTENWKRPQSEVSTLMELICEYLARETEEMYRQNVRLRFLGDISALPEKSKSAIAKSEMRLKDNTGVTVNILMNYGGRDEIVRAAKRLCERAAEENADLAKIFTEEAFSRELYTAEMPDPELIIRTAGEQRLSNFLTWQSAYSEFYFTDAYWPDFTDEEFDKALEFYFTRKRKFGGL